MPAENKILGDLLAELSSTLADVVVAIQEQKQPAEEIASTLADLLQAIEKRAQGADLEAITAAVRAIRLEAPKVTVENKIEVKPTPIQNIIQPAPVHVEIRDSDHEIDVKVEYDNFDRITAMRLRRVPAKK